MGLEDGNGTVTIKPHTDGEHMSDEVLVERPGAVQVITIKRPEARSALNRAVAVGVRDAVNELDAAAELRAGGAVLTRRGAAAGPLGRGAGRSAPPATGSGWRSGRAARPGR